MAITIPDRTKVKITSDIAVRRIPNVAKVAVQNPCPVRIAPSGTAASGAVLMEPTILNDAIGYNIRDTVPFALNDEQYAVVNGTILEGFAGVTPGGLVWVDPTARPAVGSETTFSGLTHTDPADGSFPLGRGATATKIYIFAQ